MQTPAAEVWTTRKLLAWMQQAFFKKGLDSPRLLAEMLIAHVLGCERLKLYLDPDRPASPLERQTLRDLATRALAHEPVQYLVGEAWFFGLPFKVDRRVLIPRPATETIVAEVLQHARVTHGPAGAKGAGLLLADVCTGSGCIPVALLKHLPEARAVACDISKDALDVAAENAARHQVSARIDLLQGDLLAPLLEYPATRAAGTLDTFTANPPYIPDHEWKAVAPNVKDHEPHHALRGGPDGLDFIRPIFAAGPRLLKPGGLMLVEVADSHARQAAAIAAESRDLRDIRVLQDFEGLDRVIAARRA